MGGWVSGGMDVSVHVRVGGYINGWMDVPTVTSTNRQINRHTNRQTNRSTDSHTDKQTIFLVSSLVCQETKKYYDKQNILLNQCL